MTSIDIRDLVKEYGTTRALAGLTMTVRPGRVTGFLGPNGAGKSTTLRILLGLDRATSGTATVGGRPYALWDRPLRHVGALLDAAAAHPARTARGHLLALAHSNRIPRGRVTAVLEETGLAAVARRRVRTFSLGMRQRLGIAAALLGDPPVLILDEPTNGLDPEGIVWLRDLARRLAGEGRTVLISSHLMGEVAATADQVVVLGRGRLLADSPMDAFLAEHTPARVRVRTTEGERLRTALADGGLLAVPDGDGRWTVEGTEAAHVGALAARSGVPILELADERASLEDAYLRLTAGDAEFAATATPTTTPTTTRGARA
ncbi:ATP-binding cassette domain-containing protein [Streptomyces mobaraensis]|uniref:ATP-binding cassette domain-containing protein n=1 Tax=Streptomyces mobaraensis TaxID=35621 RepID=UPI0033CBD8D9